MLSLTFDNLITCFYCIVLIQLFAAILNKPIWFDSTITFGIFGIAVYTMLPFLDLYRNTYSQTAFSLLWEICLSKWRSRWSGYSAATVSKISTVIVYGVRPGSRSAASMMLDIPRTTTSPGDRAFAVAGPRVWNSLPPAIRDPSLSPSIFGKLLKTYLFV